MNLFQIGTILYQLITCQDEGTLEIHKGFKPQGLMFGKPSKGRTYGHDLYTYITDDSNAIEDGKYTPGLIWTCFEMLYELPANRPSLFVLKRRIVDTLRLYGAKDFKVLFKSFGSEHHID